MSKICFDYEEGFDSGGTPIVKRRCFCGTSACKAAEYSKAVICQCCWEMKCDHSTTGCPWYVDRDRIQALMDELARQMSPLSDNKETIQ